MHNALWHNEALIGQKLNRAALEVDDEFSAQHKEELIVVIVLVPVVFALQPAHSSGSPTSFPMFSING